jgi:transposase-like protein
MRFALSFRDVEDLLAERGIILSYETVRRWVNISGQGSQRSCVDAAPSDLERQILRLTREGFH